MKLPSSTIDIQLRGELGASLIEYFRSPLGPQARARGPKLSHRSGRANHSRTSPRRRRLIGAALRHRFAPLLPPRRVVALAQGRAAAGRARRRLFGRPRARHRNLRLSDRRRATDQAVRGAAGFQLAISARRLLPVLVVAVVVVVVVVVRVVVAATPDLGGGRRREAVLKQPGRGGARDGALAPRRATILAPDLIGAFRSPTSGARHLQPARPVPVLVLVLVAVVVVVVMAAVVAMIGTVRVVVAVASFRVVAALIVVLVAVAVSVGVVVMLAVAIVALTMERLRS